MSRDLSLLHPAMRERISKWLETTQNILIYQTVREPWEQAVLFATGRTVEGIQDGVIRLRRLGFVQYAEMLSQKRPSPGKKLTNAPPGLSYHHAFWLDGVYGGLAIDFVPTVGGKPLWNDKTAYEVAGRAAEKVGLTWSGRWKRFRETAHIQFDRGGELKVIPLAKGEYR